MNAHEAPGGHTIHLDDLSGRLPGDRIELDPSEVKHLRALRLGDGDAVMVTDGKGSLWESRLVGQGHGSTVELRGRSSVPDPLPVVLWAPVGNKQAMLWLVEKATELGVAQIQPVEFERSGSVADAGRSQSFWGKARRRAVSALKQSGAGWLPEIRAAARLPDLLGPPQPAGWLRVVLDRDGRPLSEVIAGPDTARVVLLVGPEGGLSPTELSACADAGFATATLGPNVLRFETAAVAGLAVVSQKWAVEQRISGEGSAL